MRNFLFILLLAVLLLIVGTVAFMPGRIRLVYGLSALGVVLLILLFRSVIMPAHTVRHGLDLIAAQDFNN